MITIKNFTPEDYNTIVANRNGTTEYYRVYFKFFLPLSLLLGFIGLTAKGFGYWPTAFGIAAFFYLVTQYLVSKEKWQYRNDMGEEQKYCGTFTVIKKSRKRNDYLIFTDAEELPKVDVYFAAVFEQVEVGDELYIEAAKHSRYIFRLEKGIVPLMNGQISGDNTAS